MRFYNEYESTQLIEKCQDEIMIGCLKDGNAISEMPNSANGAIRIFIRPLCTHPRCVTDLDQFSDTGNEYIAVDQNQPTGVMPFGYDSSSFDIDGKIDELYSNFENKLIVFRPKFTKNINKNFTFKNATIISLHNDNENATEFELVPNVDTTTIDFEKSIKRGEFFDLFEYDSDLHYSPMLIVCGKYAYRKRNARLVDDNKEFLTSSEKNTKRWKLTDLDDVVRVDITKYREFIIKVNDNSLFIDDITFNEILNTSEFEEVEDRTVVKTVPQKVEEPEVIETSEDSKEVVFLKALHKQTSERGLRYNFNDLVNFHTSVKTNPLTILAGLSGTGKTQLALNYAKMLSLSEDNGTLLFMPISPSYTEPGDVLGYLNSMNGLYVPSETGLVKFLQHAAEKVDQMHMVVFDEMNLSQVEYWFSPFISILEKDPADRYLTLYDADAHCINQKVYPNQLKINENVIFVGTVNIDETTKEFSDRLLDRTFVINLEKMTFEQFYTESKTAKKSEVDISTARCTSAVMFRSWTNGNSSYLNVFDNHLEELQFLDELDFVMKKYIPNGGISYRMLKNIGNYLLNIPQCAGIQDNMLISRKIAFDIIVNQSVMTKIRGTESQLELLVGQLNDDDELENSLIMDIVMKYQQVSDFERVIKTLKNKAKELNINGYAN